MTKERRDQVLLGFLSTTGHGILALAILFNYGPSGNSAAWSIASEFWQRWLSPGMFLAIAVLAAIGIFNLRALRWSLYAGAVVMWVWAFSLASAWVLGFGPQPSCIWIACIGFMKWRYGDTWLLLERQTIKIKETTTVLKDFVETSGVERQVLIAKREHDAGDYDAAVPHLSRG